MSKAKKITQKKTAKKTINKTKKKKKETRGRKLFDGKDEKIVVQKLETAFALGSTVLEAIFHAGICKTAYYEYLKVNPLFADTIEVIQAKPTLQARQEVIKGFTNNPEFSLKYLERKAKAEFAPSFTGILDDGRGGGILTEERKAEIARTAEAWRGNNKKENNESS